MPDKDKEVLFPVAGLNVATEFGRQPPKTTPLGMNVRAYDALQKRGRGGSRAGLVKFIFDTVPAGAHLIQHLNVVVDPQAPALLAGGDVFGTTFPDPDVRWGGRPVRVGGDAITPNRNLQRQPASNNVAVVAKIRTQDSSATGGVPVAFDFSTLIASGHLILVFASCSGVNGDPNDVTVTNGVGTAYTKVSDSDTAAIFTSTVRGLSPTLASAAAYYLIATGSTADKTVKVTGSTDGAVGFDAYHIRHQQELLPIGTANVNTVSGDTDDADLGSIDFPTVTTDGPNCLVFTAAVIPGDHGGFNMAEQDGFSFSGFVGQEFTYAAYKSLALGGSITPVQATAPPPTLVAYGSISLFVRSS